MNQQVTGGPLLASTGRSHLNEKGHPLRGTDSQLLTPTGVQIQQDWWMLAYPKAT